MVLILVAPSMDSIGSMEMHRFRPSTIDSLFNFEIFKRQLSSPKYIKYKKFSDAFKIEIDTNEKSEDTQNNSIPNERVNFHLYFGYFFKHNQHRFGILHDQ